MIEVLFVHIVKENVLALKEKKPHVNPICHAYPIFPRKLFQLSLVLWPRKEQPVVRPADCKLKSDKLSYNEPSKEHMSAFLPLASFSGILFPM